MAILEQMAPPWSTRPSMSITVPAGASRLIAGNLTKGSLALFVQVMGAWDDQRPTVDLVDVLRT